MASLDDDKVHDVEIGIIGSGSMGAVSEPHESCSSLADLRRRG